ncbi:hypothetical protein LEP1GSC193_2359 [Leptospira alstonii serovar Pingchang str. 80-412]|uniref:Uncharacterized protein n=2 Tax=Leptospira alstonii TaxID=28452 RepID=M6D1T4_9LEPT|nr:hypothetical protein LEP1GSC194_2396 [Leptospira alstonii serovar Sichuan str. 79601]EQA81066.1 hypothetical protein LEP1GSC193_2359 [Leptospira alstonii serovar Pingchang str. 80-412]
MKLFTKLILIFVKNFRAKDRHRVKLSDFRIDFRNRVILQ